jgi:hypothetical protein
LAHPIGSATGATYTIASAAINDAGIYFVKAVNSQGAAESDHATLTVTADPPLTLIQALGQTNRTDILLSFSAPIAPGCLDMVAAFQFTVDPRGSGSSLTPINSAVVNGTNVLLTTDEQRVEGVDYTVTILEILTNTCSGNDISGTFDVWESKLLLNINDTQEWSYNESGVDPGPTWMNAGFNDTAWHTYQQEWKVGSIKEFRDGQLIVHWGDPPWDSRASSI